MNLETFDFGLLVAILGLYLFVMALVVSRSEGIERGAVVVVSMLAVGVVHLLVAAAPALLPEVAQSASLWLSLVGLVVVAIFATYPATLLWGGGSFGWRIAWVASPIYILLLVLYLMVGSGVEFLDVTPIGDGVSAAQLFRYALLLVTLIYAFVPAIYSLARGRAPQLRRYSIAISYLGVVAILLSLLPQYALWVLLSYMVWVLLLPIFVAKSNNLTLDTEPVAEPILTEAVWQAEDYLWRSIVFAMSDGELWRNSQFKLEELARAVGSNRTTISTLIHRKSGGSFNDYVANYRIEAFCDLLNGGSEESISTLFQTVGFNSQSSALKHFRRLHNMTPSQYITTLSPNLKSQS